MKDIVVFKDRSKNDIFDPEDHVINIMTPKTFNAGSKGLANKAAFLYKGFPMYLDRTVLHVRKEDKALGQEFLGSIKEEVELKEAFAVYKKGPAIRPADHADSPYDHPEHGKFIKKYHDEEEAHRITKNMMDGLSHHSKMNGVKYHVKPMKEEVEPIKELSVNKLQQFRKESTSLLERINTVRKNLGK